MTLALLATAARLLHSWSPVWLTGLLLTYLLTTPLCWARAATCPPTAALLTRGWTPVLSAMLISSAGGKILNSTISKYPGIAAFQVCLLVGTGSMFICSSP